MTAGEPTSAKSDSIDAAPAGPTGLRRAAQFVLQIPSRYRVSLGVLFAPAIATAIARWRLGTNPAEGSIRLLGYGWPTTLEDGRVWTLLTGAFVSRPLVISFAPSFSFISVVLLESKARHWRTAAVFLGGQIVGVLLALLLTAPLRGGDGAFAREMTQTVDFGFSVGGFAALGAWTCYIRPSIGRPVRWGVSIYLACMLLFSGLIFDVSHPIGWVLGIIAGRVFTSDRAEQNREAHAIGEQRGRPAGPPVERLVAADVAWILVATGIGLGVGLYAAWNAGGVGGAFGWGPGR
ncbi:hypothetical protein BH10ACT3_BH10ACT3_02050 [soil metagenome]